MKKLAAELLRRQCNSGLEKTSIAHCRVSALILNANDVKDKDIIN